MPKMEKKESPATKIEAYPPSANLEKHRKNINTPSDKTAKSLTLLTIYAPINPKINTTVFPKLRYLIKVMKDDTQNILSVPTDTR